MNKNMVTKLILLFILISCLITILLLTKSEANISIVKSFTEFDTIINSKSNDNVIIDLRDNIDFKEAHITGAINMQYNDDNESFLKAFKDKKLKNKQVYLICYAGSRASKVFNLLIENNYKNLHYVTFGVSDYISTLANGYDVQETQISKETFSISYNDIFPDIQFVDNKNVKTSVKDFSEEIKIVCYLSNECNTCIDSLNILNRIMSIWSSDKIKLIILWKDEIPTSITDKYNMTESISYSLENKYILSNSTPTMFILDKDNKVVFNDKGVMDTFITKLIDMAICEENQLLNQTNSYINEFIVKSNNAKPTLIFFSEANCNSCIEIEELINKEKISEKYNIVKLSNSNENQDDNERDYGNLFKKIYGVNRYPTLLLITKEGERSYYNLENKKILEDIFK